MTETMTSTTTPATRQASRSTYLDVRGLRYHVRHWGREDAPKLFLVHGWLDNSATFQFFVDALQGDWHCIAPDWRGFGLTQRTTSDCYWFADYLGDLDAVLDHYAPHESVYLLGHSMGGNVASLYAGVRPSKIARLINLEGFGMPRTRPSMAPQRYRQWLDQLLAMDAGELQFKPYASLDAVAQRLQKTNPRLRLDHAQFLASHWAQPTQRESMLGMEAPESGALTIATRSRRRHPRWCQG